MLAKYNYWTVLYTVFRSRYQKRCATRRKFEKSSRNRKPTVSELKRSILRNAKRCAVSNKILKDWNRKIM